MGEIVKYVILTFILLFVVMYGIISYAKYVEDKRLNGCCLMDVIASIIILIIVSLMI